MARSGLVAVASLDGGPINRDDAVALGLCGANDALHLDGAILRAADRDIAVAEDYAREGARALAFLGEPREANALAAALGVSGSGAATLAMQAITHWHSDPEKQLKGEWSLIQWDESNRELTIAASPARRDQVFVARRGGRVAISPSISSLADLPWVGRTIDNVGLARAVAQREVRNADPYATMLPGVIRLPPGELLRMDSAGRQRIERAAEPPEAPWHGDFEDAVVALDMALRAEVRETVTPHRGIAVQLSGGLDSSLLACIVAEERRADQNVVLLCSVPPEGSGLPDERAFAELVARHIGLPLVLVASDPAADMFEPDWASVLDDGPSLRTTHTTNTALQRAAAAHGATVLIDGIGGEDHISREFRFAGRMPDPREWLRAMRRAVEGMTRADHGNFHVRLTPGFRAHLPDEFRRSPQRRAARPVPRDALIGDPIMYSMPYAQTSVGDHDVRYAIPYRGRALQQLATRLPAAFTERDGMTRALARAMLRGRVPDEVRLRPTSAISAAPGHFLHLQAQAAALPQRITTFRHHGVDEIVDLDWLNAAARRVAARGARSWHEVHEMQLTAMLASFLSEWRRRS